MAKSFLSKMRNYNKIILIITIIVFILLIILGVVLGPDKTWRQPNNQNRTESRE
jgi:amino acid transporter